MGESGCRGSEGGGATALARCPRRDANDIWTGGRSGCRACRTAIGSTAAAALSVLSRACQPALPRRPMPAPRETQRTQAGSPAASDGRHGPAGRAVLALDPATTRRRRRRPRRPAVPPAAAFGRGSGRATAPSAARCRPTMGGLHTPVENAKATGWGRRPCTARLHGQLLREAPFPRHGRVFPVCFRMSLHVSQCFAIA